jgi:PAS domain S-box-containing protein
MCRNPESPLQPQQPQFPVNSNDLRRIFRGMPGPFLVLKPDASYTIVAASDEYLQATHTDPSIFGRPLFEVFPDNPDQADAYGVRNLSASLARVVATRTPDTMATQRHDVPLPAARGGGFEERYWAALNSPVLGDDGAVEYIVHRVDDASISAQKNSRVEHEHLIAESEKQRRIYETALDSTPDFVYVFDLEHRALYANEALVKVWGVGDVRGKKWMDLGYEQWHADMHDREIDTVISTRAPIRGEIPFTGTNGTRVYDYIFAPVLGPDGEVVAVAGTTRDITDRQAAEQVLREQAERLAESDRAKDEFLATLSHELRNPLAPLRNSLAMLRMAGMEDDRTAPIHAMMERQVNHLVRLVDDLLEISRISRGTFSLRKERVELAAVVRNAVETSDPLIRAGRHALVVELLDEPQWLEGDPVRLAQILANLLNNAAKYTPDGGHITLRAWREGGRAAISVRDTGIGIEPDALPRMFEMFSRGDRDSGHGQGGLGIGLALSLRLAEMHGGTLDAHSEGAGKGSEFTVRLPLAAAGEQPEPAPADTGGALGQTRVLVVDDNDDAGDSLGTILELLGADVRVVRDGAAALEAFATYAPSVVLLDIGMPGMNGYEVARAVRERFPDRTATLVALTGWGQDDDRRRAREAGFDHHLVKPAELDALQQLLASLEQPENNLRLRP